MSRRLCVEYLLLTYSYLLTGFSSFPEYHNTREGSSSFFEVALVRPMNHVPQTYAVVVKEAPLFYNLHAIRHYTSHTEALTMGNAVVDEAQPNDRIVVYAAAQYPMWSEWLNRLVSSAPT